MAGNIITSIISVTGELQSQDGYHYHHEGKFITNDSISFEVTGIGSLGSWKDYYITGVRSK